MNNQYIIIGGIVFGAIVLLAALIKFVSNNYIKIPPNTAAVVYGRKHAIKTIVNGKETTVEKGYKIITGGGFFKIPIIEDKKFMNLSNRTLNVKVIDAPNKDGVMTTVEGVANVKFASELNLLSVAVERFLDKREDEINANILQNLEGHLRAVVGKMSMESLIGDKTELNKAVLEEANDDFNKMGINIDFLNIQDIRDNDDYIKNLGRKRAAEIRRDAEIGTADADRDSLKKTSGAKREGIEESNQNEMKIYESNKERDIKKAGMKVLVDTQNETANQAGPLAQARALKDVVEAQAATETAQETAQTKVEAARALKEEQRYNAEIVVPAEAEKKAQIIKADAVKQSIIIEADGKREATIKIAEGDAEATRVKKIGEAEGDAALIVKKGEAEGKAIYAKLSGEAKGIKEKAEAYAKLDQTGKFLEILTALQTLGPNVIKEFAGVMSAATAHLGNIKDVKVIDFGRNGQGGSSVGNFGTIPVEILTKIFSGLQGTGFDITQLLGFLGIKPEDIVKSLPKSDETPTTSKK